MPRKTVVCPECGKPVPSGRLACPACGSLVAAVTGPARRSSRASASNRASEPTSTERTLVEPGTDQATNGADRLEHAAPMRTPATAADLLGTSQPMQPSKHRSAALGPSIPPVLADWPPRPPRTLDDPTGRDLEADHSSGWDRPPTTAETIAAPASEPVSGAYVPPSTPVSPGSTVLAPSSVFNAGPGRAAKVDPQALAASAVAVPSAPATEEKPLRPGSAALFADLPFDAPNTLIGWLVAFGTGAATLGFFLPWSGIVIGAATSGGGFTETWGLASPTHLLVLLVSTGGFLLSVLPNRVPTWLRTTLLGLVLGGLLIGLAWPYLFAAGLGYRVGVIAEIAGALVLIVAGVLSILPSRHDSEPTAV